MAERELPDVFHVDRFDESKSPLNAWEKGSWTFFRVHAREGLADCHWPTTSV